jgi:hypothetical protein
MNKDELTSDIKFNYIPINSDSVKELFISGLESINNNIDINNPLFFGIFDIRVNQSPITTIQQTINIAIDGSASMTESCNDGKEKIQHIKHTVKNILNYILSKPEIKIILNVFVFESKVTDILINETVTQENIEELKRKIDKINADGGTNIEFALKKFIELSKNNSGVISNIFMSDGYANEGVTNTKKLTGLVNESVSNTFIGFGIEHNPQLLSDLSSGNNASYFYIDILENAGHVYGEILHGILYKRFKNTILTIQNGLVYNWKTNSWSTSLLIGDLISDTCKQYHIISNNCEEVKCILTGDDILSDFHMSKEFCFNEFYDDLTKYYFRQKTLQMLFNSRHLNNNNDDDDENEDEYYSYNLDTIKLYNEEDKKKQMDEIKEKNENIKLFKKQMKNLIKEMENYVKEYNITEDKFIKNLCLDIAICYKTIGTKLGQMYSCSRQTSQGTQRVHSVRTPRKNQYSLTPCSKNSYKFLNNNSDNNNSDDDSVFNGLKSPRKNKTNQFNSFDSLDHLLNEDEEDDDDEEDDVIDKYIHDDITLELDIDIDTPHYCSNTLMTTIRSINEKDDDKKDDDKKDD